MGKIIYEWKYPNRKQLDETKKNRRRRRINGDGTQKKSKNLFWLLIPHPPSNYELIGMYSNIGVCIVLYRCVIKKNRAARINITFRLYFDGQFRLYCILTCTKWIGGAEKRGRSAKPKQATERRTNNLLLFFLFKSNYRREDGGKTAHIHFS